MECIKFQFFVDFIKLYFIDSFYLQVIYVFFSYLGCSIISDFGSSSFFDIYQVIESEVGDMDLSGLLEIVVDFEDDDDEEDIERVLDFLMSRDIVRDCLEKDLIDWIDDDIE